MSAPPAPEDLRAFITRVLATSESRVMAVSWLRAPPQEPRESAQPSELVSIFRREDFPSWT